MHTPDQIKEAISLLPELELDDIIHQWKCAHSQHNKLYKPFLDACEKELRKRRKVPDETEVSTESDSQIS